MVKKLSFLLILSLTLTLCAACSAPANETTETIFYEDGSYLVITTVASGHMTTDIIENPAEVMPQSNQNQGGYSADPLSHISNFEDSERTVRNQEAIDSIDQRDYIGSDYDRNGMLIYNSEIATKYCSYYSADDRLLWTMSLTGIFRENIIDRNCDVVSSNVTISEQDSWYVIAETEEKDIDDLFYTVRFGRKNLGVTIAESSYTITLSRDEKGNFH